MKDIAIKSTSIKLSTVKFIKNPADDKEITYKDLLEYCLDVVPQGGYTPSDIRERNRIQVAIDKIESDKLSLEDSDYDNLVKIIKASRWTIRDSELGEFLDVFNIK